MTTPTADARPTCDGFRWIGQPFYSCDDCGRPAWEHAGMHAFNRDAGPFDRDPGHTEPWKLGEAEAIRVKWEPSWHVAAGCSHLGRWVHGAACPAKPANVEAAARAEENRMPERVYMNRRAGEERIHVEITAAEITDLLTDLATMPGPVSPAMNVLVCLLDHAEGQFAAAVARSKEQPR